MLVDASAELLCPKLFDVLPTVNEAYRSHRHGNEVVTSQLFRGFIALDGRAAIAVGRKVGGWMQIALVNNNPFRTETWDFYCYPKDGFLHMHLNPNTQGEKGESALVSGTTFDYEEYQRPFSGKTLWPPSVSFMFKKGVKLDKKILTAGDIDFEESRVEGDIPIGMNTPEKAAALLRNITDALKNSKPLVKPFMRELDSHRIQPVPERTSYTQAWF